MIPPLGIAGILVLLLIAYFAFRFLINNKGFEKHLDGNEIKMDREVQDILDDRANLTEEGERKKEEKLQKIQEAKDEIKALRKGGMK